MIALLHDTQPPRNIVWSVTFSKKTSPFLHSNSAVHAEIFQSGVSGFSVCYLDSMHTLNSGSQPS